MDHKNETGAKKQQVIIGRQHPELKHSTSVSIHVGPLWHLMNEKKKLCSCIGSFVLLSWLQAFTCLQQPFYSWMSNLAPCRKEQRGFSKFLRPKEVATDFLSSKCPETPRGLDVDFFHDHGSL